MLRFHLDDVYDLAWSPCSQLLLRQAATQPAAGGGGGSQMYGTDTECSGAGKFWPKPVRSSGSSLNEKEKFLNAFLFLYSNGKHLQILKNSLQ